MDRRRAAVNREPGRAAGSSRLLFVHVIDELRQLEAERTSRAWCDTADRDRSSNVCGDV